MFAPGLRGCGYKVAPGRSKWLSRDPIAERGGVNLYGFVGNNPLSRIDKLGLSLVCNKCKEGNLRYARAVDYSLLPIVNAGKPDAVEAAEGALSASEWLGLI